MSATPSNITQQNSSAGDLVNLVSSIWSCCLSAHMGPSPVQIPKLRPLTCFIYHYQGVQRAVFFAVETKCKKKKKDWHFLFHCSRLVPLQHRQQGTKIMWKKNHTGGFQGKKNAQRTSKLLQMYEPEGPRLCQSATSAHIGTVALWRWPRCSRSLKPDFHLASPAWTGLVQLKSLTTVSSL